MQNIASAHLKGPEWLLSPLNPKDFESDDPIKREKFVQSLGWAFLEQGFVVLEDPNLGQGLIPKFYKTAHELFSRSMQQRLKEFEFVNEGLDRGYVASPSGAYKPADVLLEEYPTTLTVAGLRLKFISLDNISSVIISGRGKQYVTPLPKSVFDPLHTETELNITHADRNVRIRRIDLGNKYQVYAPDDKHGWIIGANHNLYPDEAGDFSTISQIIYESRATMGIRVTHALASFLGDKNNNLLSLVTRVFDKNQAPHALRVYHYPKIYKNDADDHDSQCLNIRAGEHKDISLFTILAKSNLPGLQVQKFDGSWVNVRIPDGTIIVMAGEILFQMTRGLSSALGNSLEIRPPNHRVVSNATEITQDRFSSPFFFNPAPYKSVLNLDSQQPIMVRNVVLDPALRLVHSHMKASTRFGQMTFEEYAKAHKDFGSNIRVAIARRNLNGFIYTP